jgi:hypothetical protein
MPAQIVYRQDASQALNPIELGVNFIDTADTYGPEVSERLIAEAPSRCRAWSTQRTGLRQVTLISQCAREGSSVSRFRQKATRRAPASPFGARRLCGWAGAQVGPGRGCRGRLRGVSGVMKSAARERLLDRRFSLGVERLRAANPPTFNSVLCDPKPSDLQGNSISPIRRSPPQRLGLVAGLAAPMRSRFLRSCARRRDRARDVVHIVLCQRAAVEEQSSVAHDADDRRLGGNSSRACSRTARAASTASGSSSPRVSSSTDGRSRRRTLEA